ncbi:YlxR family protein [Taurinivorans muris]|jgi:Predicted nucleic-acid-binding protein implicated in transcription termination
MKNNGSTCFFGKMKKEKHIPMRMCVFCRKKFAKKDSIRYVFSRENEEQYGGTLEVDLAQTKEGRGYYVCSSEECQQKITQKGSIRRKRKGA